MSDCAVWLKKLFRIMLLTFLLLMAGFVTTNSVQGDDCQIPKDFTGDEVNINWSPGSPESLNALALNPSGTVLAISTNNAVFLYDLDTLIELQTLTHTEVLGGGYPVAWSPDGTKLATFLTPMNGILIWDIEGQKISKTLVIPGDNPRSISYSLTWSPDGTKLAAVGTNGLQTRVWDVENERILYQAAFYINPPPEDYFGTSTTITWSPDGAYLVFPYGSFLYVLETSTWTEITRFLAGDTRNILGLAWSKSGYLAAVGDSDSVFLWDTNTWESLEIPSGEAFSQSFAVSWSPDETLLAVGRSRIVDIIDFAERKIVQQLPEHNAPVYDMIWLPDNQMLTRSRDGWIFRWNLTTECVEAAVRVVEE